MPIGIRMSIYEKIVRDNGDFIDASWENLSCKLSRVAPRTRGKLPYTTVNGVYDDHSRTDPENWTNGFWAGLMWLMYVGTKDDIYKSAAVDAEELLEAAAKDYDKLHHDVGFMWHISSGVRYRLFGDEDAKNRAMYMAATLLSRYNLSSKTIRAWPPFGGSDNLKKVIIDCMMNIPILYWASRESNDPRFALVAESHADTTMRNHIRADGSVNHILEYDPFTGELTDSLGGQGAYAGSSWSRGQSWGLYGFVLSYIHTGKQEYLDAAKKIAHYFIANVSETGYVPLCDFRQPPEPVYFDTTAGAIAACGLIEIAKNVPESEKSLYLSSALKMLTALNEKHCDWSDTEDSILQDGTEAYICHRHHIPIIYGDYYFAEAIYKLKGFEPLFW